MNILELFYFSCDQIGNCQISFFYLFLWLYFGSLMVLSLDLLLIALCAMWCFQLFCKMPEEDRWVSGFPSLCFISVVAVFGRVLCLCSVWGLNWNEMTRLHFIWIMGKIRGKEKPKKIKGKRKMWRKIKNKYGFDNIFFYGHGCKKNYI